MRRWRASPSAGGSVPSPQSSTHTTGPPWAAMRWASCPIMDRSTDAVEPDTWTSRTSTPAPWRPSRKEAREVHRRRVVVVQRGVHDRTGGILVDGPGPHQHGLAVAGRGGHQGERTAQPLAEKCEKPASDDHVRGQGRHRGGVCRKTLGARTGRRRDGFGLRTLSACHVSSSIRATDGGRSGHNRWGVVPRGPVPRHQPPRGRRRGESPPTPIGRAAR